jgi:hypothetical protein
MTTREQINLWAESGVARRTADIARLKPLVRELAEKAGSSGITVADLRIVARQRGLLSDEPGRKLSFLGAVMRASGLIATGETRRSFIARSHANRHTVWTLPAQENAA